MPEPPLQAKEVGEGIDIYDPNLSKRILQLRRSRDTTTSATRVAAPTVAAIGALAQSLAPVSALISTAASSSQALTVAFTPAVQTALSQGTLSLMQSSTGPLPLAVDHFGRIIALPEIVPAYAASSFSLLPVLLPAAAAAAAASIQYRALQDAVNEIQKNVDRILTRMRDDDWGVLEAADDLAFSLVEGDGSFNIPNQLRAELAIARQSVERVFRSRRRHVRPLLEEIASETRGQDNPWTDSVRKRANEPDCWHEIFLYVGAMVVRARMAASTALVLSQDWDARAATVLTQRGVAELKDGYTSLETVLTPLVARRPAERFSDKVSLKKEKNEKLFAQTVSFVDSLREGLGAGIRALDVDVVVTIPAHEVKALGEALTAETTPQRH